MTRWKVGLASLLVLVLLVAYAQQSAFAVFGVGDVVYDPSNFFENVLQAGYQLQQLGKEVEQLEQMVLMVEDMALNIKNLNFSALPVIGGPLGTLMELYDTAHNLFFNAALIQEKFKELYGPFHADVALSGAAFAAKEWDWNQAVREAHYVAMQQQAQVPQSLQAAQDAMTAALRKSETAEGNLQVQQAGNQVLGVVASQLSTLNTLTATAAQAQATREMQQAAERDQAQLAAQRWMAGFTTVAPTTGLTTLPTLR